MHFEHAAYFFLLVLHRVQVGALKQATRIDADEGKRANEWIVHNLERECRERRIVGCWTAIWFKCVHVDTLNIVDVERRRQIIDYGVEQRLNALVLERRPTADGNERLVQRALADQRL